MAIVFQPIVALRRGKIVGAEALARFARPPQRKADAWFAEAEDVGLGGQLELFAARRADEALPHLPRGVYLSINVSPATLAKTSFHKLVSKIEGGRLVAEVTEHAPIPDYGDLARALKRLRALGMRLAIDDAGAGFASLRHILRLSPDLIKLDLTMIRNIHRDPSKQALAAGLISFELRRALDSFGDDRCATLPRKTRSSCSASATARGISWAGLPPSPYRVSRYAGRSALPG
jgi:EAL domain-containing protein (putative c-di-GMP-specific phosphodiesterase class I)